MNTPKTTDGTLLSPPPCSLPPYDEWRKLPPDEAARIWARAKGKDADEEGCMAAILEWFGSEESKAANAIAQTPPDDGTQNHG